MCFVDVIAGIVRFFTLKKNRTVRGLHLLSGSAVCMKLKRRNATTSSRPLGSRPGCRLNVIPSFAQLVSIPSLAAVPPFKEYAPDHPIPGQLRKEKGTLR